MDNTYYIYCYLLSLNFTSMFLQCIKQIFQLAQKITEIMPLGKTTYIHTYIVNMYLKGYFFVWINIVYYFRKCQLMPVEIIYRQFFKDLGIIISS